MMDYESIEKIIQGSIERGETKMPEKPDELWMFWDGNDWAKHRTKSGSLGIAYVAFSQDHARSVAKVRWESQKEFWIPVKVI